MKAILFPVIIALGFVVSQQNDKDADKYCVYTSNGQQVVVYKGDHIVHDVSLDNGAVLKSNGTLIKKNGNRVTLKDGECVNHAGKVTRRKNRNKDPK